MNARVLGLHRSLKALILLGFAFYIAWLVRTDAIVLYIAPRMTLWVKLSALALYAVAVYQLLLGLRAFRGEAEPVCDCGEPHEPGHAHAASPSLLKNSVVYGLFLLPLLLGFLLPDTSMGSHLAERKGMNLSSAAALKKEQQGGAMPPYAAASGRAAAEVAPFPFDEATKPYAALAQELIRSDVIEIRESLFVETLTALDLYLDRFIGKKAQITGFVYRQPDMGSQRFVIGRFAVQCCSADGAPFGLLAEYDGALPPGDAWVTVTGTIDKTIVDGFELMLLRPERIVRTDPAKSPYVYPNPDFGAATSAK